MKYKEAGVDIDKGIQSVKRIKAHVKKTFSSSVISDIGAFGAMYSGVFGMKEPVLVSSADGVGTKLIIAQKTGYFENVGADIVNHSIDDILSVGAKPLYFLDYIGAGKIEPDIIETIIASMSDACCEAGMSLIGGEMAEMGAVYNYEHYDIVGFITGIAEKSRIMTGSSIKPGDSIIGLKSNGFHTNGFSLVRSIIDKNKIDINASPDFSDEPLYRILLRPHRSYFNEVYPQLEKGMLTGIAHITGGGFYDNISRVLPENTDAVIKDGSWTVPPLFEMIVKAGNVDFEEARRVFNMGIGMVLFCREEHSEAIVRELDSNEELALIIGKAESGTGTVRFT